jgi:hypothetical protein
MKPAQSLAQMASVLRGKYPCRSISLGLLNIEKRFGYILAQAEQRFILAKVSFSKHGIIHLTSFRLITPCENESPTITALCECARKR